MTYTTIQGDTWDLISWRHYGSEFFIDLLIKANPIYSTMVIFPAGVVLEIPKAASDKLLSEQLPPWKRGRQ